MTETALERRRRQNLTAARTSVRSVAPSIRSFGQSIDRQRTQVERLPLLLGSRPDLLAACAALDTAEVAALALHLDDPASELGLLGELSRAAAVPVLRTDLVLEEFQIFESRAAGVDAVLLHPALLAGPLFARLCEAAASTHMAACAACATAEDLARALAARAPIVAFFADAAGRAPEALLAAVPRRVLSIVLPREVPLGDAPAAGPLLGRADALLDPQLGQSPDPGEGFRRLLQE